MPSGIGNPSDATTQQTILGGYRCRSRLIDRLAFIDRHLGKERNQGRITLDGKEQTQRGGTYRGIALASASDGLIANASEARGFAIAQPQLVENGVEGIGCDPVQDARLALVGHLAAGGPTRAIAWRAVAARRSIIRGRLSYIGPRGRGRRAKIIVATVVGFLGGCRVALAVVGAPGYLLTRCTVLRRGIAAESAQDATGQPTDRSTTPSASQGADRGARARAYPGSCQGSLPRIIGIRTR